MLMDVRLLSESIGAEVRAPIPDLLRPDVGAQLRKLLVERGVLVFPELNIDDANQLKLAANIGKVRSEGENGIFKVTLDTSANIRGDYLKGSWLWHMDGTHDLVPVFGTLLSGKRLSEEGGDTLFANSYAAYEALSDEMKAKIAPLRVVHTVNMSMERAGVEQTPENTAFWNSLPVRSHSLVWTHGSGRKSLVIGCHASHVEGMDRAESDALLEELLAWTTQDRFTYRHKWTVGDMLIWDNTGVLHRAEPYSLESGRLMHRTTLIGEEAFS